jgi:hypothetical protein
MALYRVRAHIHHYTEYMELEDIAAAAGSLTDMISAYNESESRTSGLCAPRALSTWCCVSNTADLRNMLMARISTCSRMNECISFRVCSGGG